MKSVYQKFLHVLQGSLHLSILLFQHLIQLFHTLVCKLFISSRHTCFHLWDSDWIICMYMYMLGTILKPSARFKAVRTVLKPLGPFQSRPDGIGWPASLPYIRKIRVSVAIGTQSGIRLHKRVPMVKIWGSSKND